MKKSEFIFTLGRILNDSIMIFGGLMFSFYIRMYWFEYFGLASPTPLSIENFAFSAIPITLALMFIFTINGRYKFGNDEKLWDEIWHIFWSFSAGMALILVTFFFLKYMFFSRFIFGGAWISGLVFIISGRIILRIIRRIFYKFEIGKIQVLILGTKKIAKDTINILSKLSKFQIVGVLSETKNNKKDINGVKILGTFDDFEKLLKGGKVDEVIVAIEHSTEKISTKIVRTSHIYNVKFRYLPDELGLDLSSIRTSTIGGLPIITIQNTRLGGWGYVIKSFFDLFVAVIGFILLSPIFIITAIAIKLENFRAPIIYSSKRVGRKGRIFDCYKFRTMIPDADKKKKELISKNERTGGIFFKIENDPRITKLGNFLRKTSIDELPQILNIINGDMSIIGPRPHLIEEVKKYEMNDLRVLSIKPGLTGFAQINGRSTLSFEQEMNYELFYIKNWSLWLDLIIFFKSIWIVLARKNVS